MLNKVTTKTMNHSTSPATDFDGQYLTLKEARTQIADLQKLVNVLVSSYGELKLEIELIRQSLASITQTLEDRLNTGKDQPQYLTTAEVSKRTGYTSCTILKFVKEGKINPTGYAGKFKKFHIDEVESFMGRLDLNQPRPSAQGKSKRGSSYGGNSSFNNRRAA
jgi:regulator of replication initiation timing